MRSSTFSIQDLTRSRSKRRLEGFALLEVILALALFSLVAVSLCVAFDQMARLSHAAQGDARVLRAMETALAQLMHQPRLILGEIKFPVSPEGVAVLGSVDDAKLRTREGLQLSKLYRVRVEARLAQHGGEESRRSMETYVYSENSPTR